MDGKEKCKFRFLFPVRYALTSEKNPPLRSRNTMKPGLEKLIISSGSQSFGEYDYTLRKLRSYGETFVHVYYRQESGETYRYYTVENGMPIGYDTTQEFPWIKVPLSVKEIWISFNPIKLPDALFKDAGYREQYMQHVVLDSKDPLQHTDFAKNMHEYVEEFREKTGFLDTMRENSLLQEQFRPELAYKIFKQPTKDIPNAWKHSGAPLGLIKPDKQNADKISYEYTSYQENEKQAHEAESPYTKNKNKLCDASDNEPLVVGLYDAIGVGGDLASMHWANMAAVNDYMHWYQIPVGTAVYLERIKNGIVAAKEREATNRQSEEHDYRVRNSDMLGHSDGLAEMAYSLVWVWDQLKNFRRRKYIPNENLWKSMLAWFKDDEVLMDNYITAFCAMWQQWLKKDAGDIDSLTAAFTVFIEELPETAESMEYAFLYCHHDIGFRDESAKMAYELYIKNGAPAQELFTKVVTGLNTAISDKSDSILASFTGVWDYTLQQNGGESINPFGPYAELIRNRIMFSSQDKGIGLEEIDPASILTNLSKDAEQVESISNFQKFIVAYQLSVSNDYMENKERAFAQLLTKPFIERFSVFLSSSSGTPAIQTYDTFIVASGAVNSTVTYIHKYNSLLGYAALLVSIKALTENSRDKFDEALKVLDAIHATANIMLTTAVQTDTSKILSLGIRLLWVGTALARTIYSFWQGELARGLGNLSLMVMGTVAAFTRLPTPYFVAVNILTFFAALIIAFLEKTPLEEWLSVCYWSRNDASSDRTFTYRDWDIHKLSKIKESAANDFKGFYNVVCTPGSLGYRELDGYFEFPVLVNLFHPEDGEIEVNLFLHISSQIPIKNRSIGYDGPIQFKIERMSPIDILHSPYNVHWANNKRLYYDQETSALIAVHRIKTEVFWHMCKEILPSLYYQGVPSVSVEVQATHHDRSGIYKSTSTVIPMGFPIKEIKKHSQVMNILPANE